MPKNRKPAGKDHWFICTIEFVCPDCGGNSKEMLPTASTNADPHFVAAQIAKLDFSCQICKNPLAQRASPSLTVLSTTLEIIRTSGLQLPEVFDPPKYSN
jgi:hypothetical protein